MAYAEGKGDLPHELELAFYARDFGALPEAGGIYDQPAGLLRRMKNAMDIYNLWREWKSLTAETTGNWIKRNKERWAVVQEIMRMRDG